MQHSLDSYLLPAFSNLRNDSHGSSLVAADCALAQKLSDIHLCFPDGGERVSLTEACLSAIIVR